MDKKVFSGKGIVIVVHYLRCWTGFEVEGKYSYILFLSFVQFG